MISLFLLIFILVKYLVSHVFMQLLTIITVIALFSGLQTIFIGIIGEYIGKIYSETKQRPRYIIERVLLNEK